MIIGNKKYECIVIAGDDNEVLAIIDDENIVAKKNIEVILDSENNSLDDNKI